MQGTKSDSDGGANDSKLTPSDSPPTTSRNSPVDPNPMEVSSPVSRSSDGGVNEKDEQSNAEPPNLGNLS